MPKIDLHLTLEFSDNIKPVTAAAFAKAAIEAGYLPIAGADDELVADAADAFEDAHVSPLAGTITATAVSVVSPAPVASKEKPAVSAGQVVIDAEALKALMYGAHYHTEDLQELEDEGTLTNDAQHRAHMKSLRSAVDAACTVLGVRKPKSL